MDLSTIDLCAGNGGISLGLRLAGVNAVTRCYVENELTAAEVLAARIEDGLLDDAPIWTDVRTFDGTAWRNKIHLVTAGYPCQPFSNAGKRKGSRDPRHLFPHVARVVDQCRPAAVFIENVQGHFKTGFFEVARSLQQMGYVCQADCFAAQEAGATQLRGGCLPCLSKRKRWPTPQEDNANNSGAGPSRAARMGKGGHNDLTVAAARWPAPAHRDYRHPNAKSYRQRGGASKGEQLNNFAAKWKTVTATSGGPDAPKRARKNGNGNLQHQAMTACRHFRQDRKTSKAGCNCSSAGRLLNPLFVEHLMGLPIEWTDSACLAMASFQSWLHTHTSRLRDVMALHGCSAAEASSN